VNLGSIGGSDADSDYRMSTYDSAFLRLLDAVFGPDSEASGPRN
jgi:hypothetical protein